MMGKNSFSLLPQLNLLVVAPVNVIKYHFFRVDGLLDDETGTACSSDVTLANTGILNCC